MQGCVVEIAHRHREDEITLSDRPVLPPLGSPTPAQVGAVQGPARPAHGRGIESSAGVAEVDRLGQFGQGHGSILPDVRRRPAATTLEG